MWDMKRASVHLSFSIVAYVHLPIRGRQFKGREESLVDLQIFSPSTRRNFLSRPRSAPHSERRLPRWLRPWKTWISRNFTYGSGFLDGDGPAHLPSSHVVDLSVGKSFWGELVGKTDGHKLYQQALLY